MDKLIYTAMSGAKATMAQQAAVAQNLANSATNGFRSEVHRLRAAQVESESLPTRAFVVDASVGTNFSQGPMTFTNRPLDMAIQGSGWFSVQTPNGEAYTRDGSFQLDASGTLRTRQGLEVLSDSGPITIPPDNAVEVAADGTITATPTTGRAISNPVGRLKLVNPPEEQMQRGDDGLFRVADGQTAARDEVIKVSGGYLEGSNVNVVEQMVNMIALSRHFEMQTKLLETAKEDDRTATAILTR